MKKRGEYKNKFYAFAAPTHCRRVENVLAAKALADSEAAN